MLSLILLLSLLCPPARAVYIIYVEPVGQALTVAEQTAARAGVQAAIDYWQALAPSPVPLAIASERTITATGDVTAGFEWSRAYWTNGITIFVIDTDRPLLGAYLAQSQTALGLIWAVRGSGDTFAATMAHELGHVVYGLPHQYQAAIDIMGLDPTPAYQRRTIGCATLARLGRPCVAVWLPLVGWWSGRWASGYGVKPRSVSHDEKRGAPPSLMTRGRGAVGMPRGEMGGIGEMWPASSTLTRPGRAVGISFHLKQQPRFSP